MSILIKDMELPKDCPYCKMAHYNASDEFTGCAVIPGKRYAMHNDAVYAKSTQRPDWCPLIEIPEHIKQDELIRCKDYKYYEWMSNRIPEEQTWHCHCWDADTGKDDFCSYAERRTE